MIQAKAQLSNLRMSPRKVRLVADTIRGCDVTKALGQLDYDLRDVSPVLAKLVRSAQANAKSNHDYTGDLVISEIQVGEGPTMKRWRPRAYGRASKILKRTSKITVVVSQVAKAENKPTKSEKKPAEAKPEKKAEAKPVKAEKTDFTKIEGVGPKIAQTLTDAGIETFADLANKKPEEIQEVIKDVRGSHDATTWPQQASLAAEGKWDELKQWQDELDGGKA